jgi:hypothetical protein
MARMNTNGSFAHLQDKVRRSSSKTRKADLETDTEVA